MPHPVHKFERLRGGQKRLTGGRAVTIFLNRKNAIPRGSRAPRLGQQVRIMTDPPEGQRAITLRNINDRPLRDEDRSSGVEIHSFQKAFDEAVFGVRAVIIPMPIGSGYRQK